MTSPLSSSPAGGANRSISQTVSRSIRVMEVLAGANTPLSAVDLALAVGIDRAIIYRLLRTLAAHNLVTNAQDGGFTLGVGLLALSRGVQRHLREITLPHLLVLAQESHATAFIGVREGDEVVCVATVEASAAIVSVRFREGLRRPMSRGASAIAILSSLPERPDDSIEVKIARDKGYATSHGVVEIGASAVSSPIVLPGGPGQACVTAIFPSNPEREFDEIARHVKHAAQSISMAARLG